MRTWATLDFCKTTLGLQATATVWAKVMTNGYLVQGLFAKQGILGYNLERGRMELDSEAELQ